MEKFLIIGLGNYSQEYHNTRHNVGFIVLDSLANKLNLSFKNTAKNYMSLTINLPESQTTLIKPLTFMNLSGEAVQSFLTKNDVKGENIHVICDNLNTNFGILKSKFAGGLGGHNGLRSITEKIGNNYWKHLFGIGRPDNENIPINSYVLSKFLPEEIDFIENIFLLELLKTFSFLKI